MVFFVVFFLWCFSCGGVFQTSPKVSTEVMDVVKDCHQNICVVVFFCGGFFEVVFSGGVFLWWCFQTSPKVSTEVMDVVKDCHQNICGCVFFVVVFFEVVFSGGVFCGVFVVVFFKHRPKFLLK